jgi:hypothetical protein
VIQQQNIGHGERSHFEGRRRGRDVERNDDNNNRNAGWASSRKRIRTVSPDRVDEKDDGTDYRKRGSQQGESLLSDILPGTIRCIGHDMSFLRLRIYSIFSLIDRALLTVNDSPSSASGMRLWENSNQALEELCSYLLERPVEFLEILLECNGSQRLLCLVRLCQRRQQQQTMAKGCQCTDTRYVAVSAAAHQSVQLLARCLFYSQSHDGNQLLDASNRLAKQVIIDDNGIDILVQAIETWFGMRQLGHHYIDDDDDGRAWKITTESWVLLNNMTLFGAVMGEVNDRQKIRLVCTALAFLDSHHGPHGGKIHIATQLLAVYSSVFGVLSNVLACSKSPTSCLDSAYIDFQAIRRCKLFVRRLGPQLFEPTLTHQTLLVRVLDFLDQCTRRPSFHTKGLSNQDYQEFLLPLCVDSMMRFSSASWQSSSTETVMLWGKMRLHTCLILSNCAKDSRVDQVVMENSGVISALNMVSQSMRLVPHGPSNFAYGRGLFGDEREITICSRLTQLLARKIQRQISNPIE